MYAILITLLAAVIARPADPPACQARLEVQQAAGTLTVSGHCRNAATAAARWRYELRTDKQGQSGSARNAQSGRFVALPGQDVLLARTTLSLGARDACRVHLRVLDEEGVVLAADSLLLPMAR